MSLIGNIVNTGDSDNIRSVVLASIYKRIHRRFDSSTEASSYLAKNMYKLYITSSKFNQGLQIKNLFRKIDFEIPDEGFIYFIDEMKNLHFENQTFSNITIDYSYILKNSLYDINELYLNLDASYRFKNEEDSEYNRNQLDMLDGIELLVYRIIEELKKSKRRDKKKYISFFENIIDKKTEHFEEALQRILFFNQLFWQTGHRQVGLGRLDKILEDYYFDDINSGYITKKQASKLISDFLTSLNSLSWYKSESMIGDTGETIVLGGKYKDDYGTYYFFNDLTYMFIRALGETNLTDPKAVLRISNESPRSLFKLSLDAIALGASLTFSNDERVIDEMIRFGYDESDAYDYIVSSSFEPGIPCNIEQNNLGTISFLKPLEDIFESLTKEELMEIRDFDELLDLYEEYLLKDAYALIQELESLKWDDDTLLSLFVRECNEKEMNVSQLGTKYSNYGINTIGLAGAVNNLYNIRKIVYLDNRCDLAEFNKMRKNNFKKKKYRDVRNLLKHMSVCFGKDYPEIIYLSEELSNMLEDFIFDFENEFGGKLKFGLSSPSFMEAEENGRLFDFKTNEKPLVMDICDDFNKDFDDLLRFASNLEFGDLKINGNVVNIFVSKLFINYNFEYFIDFIYECMDDGFFQLKINVLDSIVLEEAMEDSSKHKDLMVPFFGFKTYFRQLPKEYQEHLLFRAVKAESNSRFRRFI